MVSTLPLFRVHVHPGLAESPIPNDAAHHRFHTSDEAKRAGRVVLDPESVPVLAVYDGRVDDGLSHHFPWFLTEIGGNWRPVNAAYTVRCGSGKCAVAGCTLRGTFTVELKGTPTPLAQPDDEEPNDGSAEPAPLTRMKKRIVRTADETEGKR